LQRIRQAKSSILKEIHTNAIKRTNPKSRPTLQKTLEKKFIKSYPCNKGQTYTKKTSHSFSRHTSMGTSSKVEVNKTANIPTGRSLSSSKTICNLLSFDLPTILDTSLDEESLSPRKDAKGTAITSIASRFETGRMSIGASRDLKTIRQNYLDKRKNKLSVDLRYNNVKLKKPRRSLINVKTTKEKAKPKNDENARRHLVRSHLNQLYTKLIKLVKVKEKDKRYISATVKAKHK